MPTAAAARADHERAAGYHQQLVALDPLRERAARGLMKSLAASGAIAGARTEYQRLKKALAEHDIAQPEPETTALMVEINADARGPRRVRHSGVIRRVDSANLRPSAFALAPLVGRRGELDVVRTALARGRLVTLTGPAGVGKTRLAYEIALEQSPLTEGGSWRAALAGLSAPNDLALSLAVALERASVGQAGDDSAERTGLLVVDGCDDGADGLRSLIGELLLTLPRLRILATCQRPLRVPGETLVRIEPLLVSPRAVDATNDLPDAVELFVQRIRASAPGATVEQGHLVLIEGICEQLDGVPLAIELAAHRFPFLSLEQIAKRVRRDPLEFLVARGGAGPETSLRNALDRSLDRLSESERRALRCLATFDDEFSLAEAEQLCASASLPERDTLGVLSELYDASLLMQTPNGARYRILRMTRAVASFGSSKELAIPLPVHTRWAAGDKT